MANEATQTQANGNIPPRPGNDKTTEAEICEVIFAEPMSQDADPSSAFDIVFEMKDKETGEPHRWRTEFSMNYGRGNNSSKTRAQMAVAALESVGWQGGMNVGGLADFFTGRTVPISIRYSLAKDNSQWYKNVYLGSGGLHKIDNAKMLDIVRLIAGGGSATASQAYAQPPQQQVYAQQPPQAYAPPPPAQSAPAETFRNPFGAQ